MTQIVGEADRLGQVFVAAQSTRQCAPDLRHFDAVRQPVAVVVAFGIDKDLGFVFQAAKGSGVDDAVAVALIGGAIGVFVFAIHTATAGATVHGKWS